MTRLVLAISTHSESEICLITTNDLLCRHEECFQPGEPVFTSLIKPPDQQFKGLSWTVTVQSCQTRPLELCNWGPPRDTKNVAVGDAVVTWWAHWSCILFPTVQFCSKWRWSLSLQFWVWGTQGDETPSYYTSNSKVLNKGIQANLGCIQLVGTNNECFHVCLYSCSLRGTELARTKSLLPSQAKTDLNCTQARPDQP